MTMTPKNLRELEQAATPLDVERLRKLEQAGTPAPWRANEDNGYPYISGPFDDETGIEPTVVEWNETGDEDKANAALIAAMRNALPSLLAKVERAEAERDEARESWRHVTEERDAARVNAFEADRQRDTALARVARLEALLAEACRIAHNRTTELGSGEYGRINAIRAEGGIK